MSALKEAESVYEITAQSHTADAQGVTLLTGSLAMYILTQSMCTQGFLWGSELLKVPAEVESVRQLPYPVGHQ